MKKTAICKPWDFLDEYRNKDFFGEWPTFPEMLKIQAKRNENRPFFTAFDGENGSKNTLSFSEVLEKVKNLSDWLIENGIKKGDRIVVMGKNSPEWGIAFHSVLFASAIIVPVDNGLHEAEVENIVKTAKPKIVFCDDEKSHFYTNNFPKIIVKSLNNTNPENYVYNLKAKSSVTQNEPATENETAAILFTSGTTGKPKGVMLSHKNLISDGFIAQTNLSVYNTDVFYALLPIHHAYTMQAAFIVPLEVGAEIVFGKSLAVTKLMHELKEGKITIMLGVPLLYNKLLFGIMNGIKEKGIFVSALMAFLRGISYSVKKLTGKNIGRALFKSVLQKANIYTLRVAISGGGPLASSVFKQYNAMGLDFIQGYGLTETSPIITLNPKEHFKIESVGSFFAPYEEMKIINPVPTQTSKGVLQIGEIVVKGPMVMQGYYEMPEETKAMFTEDGFLKTGDLGWIDSENYLMLCGRAKNLIVTSGGKNVCPEEVEDSFQLVGDVQQVTVRGFYENDDKTSEKIEALIYVSDELYKKLEIQRSQDFVQDEIVSEIKKDVEKVNKTLPPYSQIEKITLLKEPLEMTTSQKVKRNFVAKTY